MAFHRSLPVAVFAASLLGSSLQAGVLVDLDARDLPEGPVTAWLNDGLLGGKFEARGNPVVTVIDGQKGVTLDGGASFLVGPRSIPSIEGDMPRSIAAWVYNPVIAAEETVVSWGHRGGPNGSNMAFNHGTHNAFGAVGHWGGDGPDLGWDPTNNGVNDDPTGLGHEEAGIWSHIAYSWDGSTTRVYTNGMESNFEEGIVLATHMGQVIVVGAQQDANNSNTFTLFGSLSAGSILIFEGALSAEDMLFEFNRDAARFGRDPSPQPDGDGDGIPDFLEERYAFLDPGNAADAAADQDGDGLSNLDEILARTDLENPDSDGDGLSDGDEVHVYGTVPLNPDSDGDTLLDGDEVNVYGTDPANADTDGDTFADNVEINLGSDPLDPNSTPNAVVLAVSNVQAAQSWVTPGVWNDGLAPAAGKQYSVIGGVADVLQTPTASPAVFAGDSLRLAGASAQLRLRSAQTTIGSLILGGGRLAHGTRGQVELRGTLRVDEDSVVDAGGPGNVLTIRSRLTGSGDLLFTQATVGDPGTVELTGVANEFDAAVEVSGVLLKARQPGSLGGGDITLRAGGRIDFDYNHSGPDASLFVQGDQFRLILDQDLVFERFAAIREDGTPFFELAPGSYTTADLLIAGFNEEQVEGNGTLYILGEDGGTLDTDGDGLLDAWEMAEFGSLDQDPGDDGDGDGLSNKGEFEAGSSPTAADSDSDGLNDGDEVLVHGSNPVLSDTDGDGVTDGDEVNRMAGGAPAPTDPTRRDTDGDLLDDGVETDTGIFVGLEDTGTDPLNPDTDGDGWGDGLEVFSGTDPLDAEDRPAFGVDTRVAVDAELLPEGEVTAWPNLGTLSGAFIPEDGPVTVQVIDGRKGVTLDGATFLRGPAASSDLVGANPRSIAAWVYNPDLLEEETVVAWGRRGGPDGTNMSFNHGTHNAYGAVGHWGGAGPDLGWDPSNNGVNNDNTGQQREEAGIWSFIAYTQDGQTTRVYTNGIQSNSESPIVLNTWDVDTNGQPLSILIGSQNDDTGLATAALRGSMSIAQIRIVAGVLSDEAIVEMYNLDAAAFGRDPITMGDSDSDGLVDTWELQYFGNLAQDGAGDPDGDGLSNTDEQAAGTHPLLKDTDRDGFTDGEEIAAGTDPLDIADYPDVETQILVDLDATSLAEGPVANWVNTGTLGGSFVASGSPLVETIDGVRGITLDGSQWLEGPSSTTRIEGASARSIVAWVYNPSIVDEESVVAWGRRGGPDGTNMAFNHGIHDTFGAVGHWGAPDIGWNNEEEMAIWSFIGYTQDGTTTRVYTNGQLSNSETPITLNTYGGMGILIGAQREPDGTTVNTALTGTLSVAKVRIYDGALSGLEMAALYDADAALFGRDPIDPGTVDTDRDGFTDTEEAVAGTDPLDPTDYPNVPANLVVELSAEDLPLGPLAAWANTGSLGGNFTAAGDPAVEIIDGVTGVSLDGVGDWLEGPVSVPKIEGASARTIAAWVYNPDLLDEETVVAWGRRGGPDGTNMSFNHGAHEAFGAVGHWGAPDIGWNGDEEAGIWSFIAYTQDAVDTRVYTNGQLSNSESPITLNTFGGMGILIGAQREPDGVAVNTALLGSLSVARVWIYDGALSAGQVASLYNSEAAAFGRPPIDGGGDDGFFVSAVNRTPAGDVSLSWASIDGVTDTVQFSETMETATWLDIGQVPGTGAPSSFIDSDADRTSLEEGYYRVVRPTGGQGGG